MYNVDNLIENFKNTFSASAARHPLYESTNDEIPNAKYVKTKEDEKAILEYLATSGFVKYDDYTLYNVKENVFVQLDENEGRTIVYFINNLNERMIVEEATQDVDQLAPYFKKIAGSLNSKAVAMKKRNPAMSQMYKQYYEKFNHLDAQAQLNRKDRVIMDFKETIDPDAIGFIHSELSEEEFEKFEQMIDEIGLPPL